MNIGNTVHKIIVSALLTLLVALPAAADAPVVTAAIDLQTLPSVPTYSPADQAVSKADVSTVSLAGTAIGLNRAGIIASAPDFTALPVLNVGSVPPLVMFVMSRDEQLFIKAYSDYTDLDGDGKIDSTYNNDFDYSGYFDQALCYSYSSTGSGQFKASAAATDHQCDGSTWSGNFMNWVSMSRLDVLRFVLFGGYRATDTASTTVLERANIPDDLHAWAKVYTGTDVNSYTPYTQGADNSGVAFCSSSRSDSAAPSLRVAQGNWSEWASTALRQCNWKSEASTGSDGSYPDVPSQTDDYGNEYSVRVQVCDPTNGTLRESFCERYKNGGTPSYKPRGLLQQYGENGAMRFGLITGSFGNPRSGGRLRRNIGKLAGNGPLDANGNYTGCVSTDEINLTDGTFCNQGSGQEGIINTLDRLRLTQWNYSSVWNDCNTYGILNRNTSAGSDNSRLKDPGSSGGAAQNCSAWGNPLTEMYDEALRYIAADGSPDSTFTSGTDLDGLPTPAWKDPYGKDSDGQVRNPYCAACSIIVLSTGLNSFDSDELPTWTKNIGVDGPAATSSIGADEGINGGSYLVGRVLGAQSDLAVGNPLNTYEDLCTAKTVTNLSLARGICPDIPSMEGSYLISGLAYDAWTKDMRPGLKTPNGNDRPEGYKNEVQTYAIALAENTPKFQIPVGGGDITLAPLCQANNTGGAKISDGGWRSCYLGAVGIGTKTSRVDSRYIYGRPLEDDASAGSFSLVWEDSLWGNDHDNDVVSMLTYCVGASCERSTDLPTGAVVQGSTPKLCFYIDSNYNGNELCPNSTSGNFNSSWKSKVSSIRIPSGYTVTLSYDTTESYDCSTRYQHKTCTRTVTVTKSFSGDTTYVGDDFNDKATSYSITGGPVPPDALPPTYPTYDGYDICWESDSPICTDNDGRPALAADEVLVRVENLSAYAGNAMLSGYAITGSDQDGTQRLALRPGNSNGSVLSSTATAPSDWYKPKVIKYTLGTNGAKNLENPLFYAAKYGGFTDRNGDNKPDSASEWDQVDNETGETGADGQPDNFFQVRNPAQLGARLSRAFNAILARSGSGTAAAVVSNSANGIGLTYQALYQAERSDDDGRKVSWSGTLNGLWTDSYGYLREDSAPVTSDGSHVLQGYDVDPVITFFYDATDGKTKFKRETMPANTDGTPVTVFDEDKATSTVQSLEDLNTVWSAQEGLWDVGLNTTTQRSYTNKFSDGNGRYIFTWIDANHNGKVDSGEQRPFLFNSNGFTDDNFRFLNTSDESAAKELVQWIRGTEIDDTDASGTPLWRSRTIKYDSNTKRVLRLGDIVNSTPVVVGTPAEAFDLLYNDESFGTFRKYYRDRRQVVYVGSNDGMVHAFNGGFYNAAAHQLQLQPPGDTSGSVNSAVIAQPLGSELWAYVPGNLLPHLRWLADPNYSHMYFVDGSPIAQDVRIFPVNAACSTDSTKCVDAEGHVDGWGTVLIVPFRFGGGPISVPTAKDSHGVISGWQNSYSAYVVMDITDPESPPTLLGELTNTDLVTDSSGNPETTDPHCTTSVTVTCATLSQIVHTYTSSLPAAAMFRDSEDNDPNKFYLFTGSGTTDNAGVGTTEGGNGSNVGGLKIRAYDFDDLADNDVTAMKTFDFTNTGSTGAGAESFAGDLIASDFNLNGLSEALYFGSVKYNESGSSFGGSLWKINFKTGAASASKESSDPDNWTQQEMLSDLNLPVTAHATVGVSDQGKPMVFFGTGRAFTKDDLGDQTQQKIVGMFDTSLLDPDDTQYKALPLSLADLVDVSDIQVQAKADGGAISDAGSYTDTSGTAHTINDFQSLVDSFDQQDRLGWYINLQNHPLKADGTQDLDDAAIASERVVSSQALLGGVLLTTTFLPGTDSCSDVGSGRLYGTNYKTGTADPSLAYFGTTAGTGTASGQNVLNRSTDLGPGLPAAPSLHVGDGTGQRVFRACVQTSTGAIICKDITTLKDVQSGEISWREPLDK